MGKLKNAIATQNSDYSAENRKPFIKAERLYTMKSVFCIDKISFHETGTYGPYWILELVLDRLTGTILNATDNLDGTSCAVMSLPATNDYRNQLLRSVVDQVPLHNVVLTEFVTKNNLKSYNLSESDGECPHGSIPENDDYEIHPF